MLYNVAVYTSPSFLENVLRFTEILSSGLANVKKLVVYHNAAIKMPGQVNISRIKSDGKGYFINQSSDLKAFK